MGKEEEKKVDRYNSIVELSYEEEHRKQRSLIAHW
jgi:hypothetical protein